MSKIENIVYSVSNKNTDIFDWWIDVDIATSSWGCSSRELSLPTGGGERTKPVPEDYIHRDSVREDYFHCDAPVSESWKKKKS